MSWPTTHGMSRSDEYQCWENMVQRCTNPNAPNWARYGGGGVTVAAEFLEFRNLYAEVGPRPGSDYSLDRKDPALGYVPGNVRWASASTQELNKLLPYEYPGTTLDTRRGSYGWRYQRNGKVTRRSGYATASEAFRAKLKYMATHGVEPSRSDKAAAAEMGPNMAHKEAIAA